MATALYVVILSRGKWFIDFEGESHGPFETRAAAALEAKLLAEITVQLKRPAEVLVPDEEGKYWVVWDSRDASAGKKRPAMPRRQNAA
ncbi:MAG: hypothetical protein ABIO40_01930 [Devosia sp.]